MKNLFTGMLSFAYPLLEDMEIGHGGPSLAPFYEMADQELSCFLCHPDISDPDDEASFLLLADYATSVPFGRTGYEEACRIAGKMGLDFPNLRYEKTAFLLSVAYEKPDPETAAYWDQELGFDVLEECTIPDEDMEEIRGYFNKESHGKFNPRSLVDLARAFATFGHELEARFGSPGLKDMEEAEKAFEAFRLALKEAFEEGKDFDLDAYLATRFEPRTLTNEEKAFLAARFLSLQPRENDIYYAYNKLLKIVVAKKKEKAVALFENGAWRPVGRKHQDFDADEEKIGSREAAFLTDGRLYSH